jgi:hypothetical protein
MSCVRVDVVRLDAVQILMLVKSCLRRSSGPLVRRVFLRGHVYIDVHHVESCESIISVFVLI